MKKSGVVLGFLPMIIYGILAGSSVASVTLALTAAIVAFLLVGWNDLCNGMMMSWANIALFGSALVAIGVLGISWLIPYMGVLIYATLAAFTLGSILIGMPFTLQYARRMVDKAFWDNPLFLQVNVMITGVWGAAFLINLGLIGITLTTPGFVGHIAQVTTYIVLIAGGLFTLWYPEQVRKSKPSIPVQIPSEI
jgi:hypothetical protein